jgi:PAS domain S-box-containing protein
LNDPPLIESAKPKTVGILLVEDNDCDALLLQTMLSGGRYGSFHFRRVDRLSAALRELAQDGGIDLILLDLGLPDSQGLETFTHIRESAAQVPIIVLSGLDDEALAITTVQQGAQDYIVKGQADSASLGRAVRYAIERFLAQQELTEEHDLLRSVIDNIPDQVYLKDMESRFVAANPVTARFFGAASPGQIVGKTDFDFFPNGLAGQFLAEEQALLSHNQPCVNREAAITDYAGNTKWMLTTKVPLHDRSGNITGLLGINRDITERKKAEDSILRMNSELERRVAERTSELLKAMARLEEHDRARGEFVSSVSHELQTPLTSMSFEIATSWRGSPAHFRTGRSSI